MVTVANFTSDLEQIRCVAGWDKQEDYFFQHNRYT